MTTTTTTITTLMFPESPKKLPPIKDFFELIIKHFLSEEPGVDGELAHSIHGSDCVVPSVPPPPDEKYFNDLGFLVGEIKKFFFVLE